MDDPEPAIFFAGVGASPLVQDLGLCLVAAALVSVVFQKLRIPAVAALLAAGLALGPVGTSFSAVLEERELLRPPTEARFDVLR